MSSSNFTARKVTVLRILDQEHHQKCDDGRSCVDYKLPCVRETEERTRNCPDHHGPECKGKDPGSTYLAGADLRDFREQLAKVPGLLGRSGFDRRLGAVIFAWGAWHDVVIQMLLRWQS